MADLPMAAEDLCRIPGQVFSMGSDEHYPEEKPVHPAHVDAFWISAHQVTNAEFAAFVDGTGYRTVAERPLDPADFPGAPPENLQPGSMVFTGSRGPVDLRHINLWWTWVPGASWRRPHGPRSDLDALAEHPVVHVAYEDAEAYAAWAGRSLPSEAEWEAAARGGLDGAAYTWGSEPEPDDAALANYWHGDFPWRAEAGYGSTRPVGSFPANGYGLYDMAGNVWEWCRDWYRPGYDAAPVRDPQGPPGGSERVQKGGSFLCSDQYCARYMPGGRGKGEPDAATNHLGFRCVMQETR